MKYQNERHLLKENHDLFTSESKPKKESFQDEIAGFNYNAIKFPKKQHPEVAIFTESNLITGTADGFIEIWNHETAKLDTNFPYQNTDDVMIMDSAVISLAVHENFLASGSVKGVISVWNLNTGKIFANFKAAHHQGVSALLFYNEGQQVLSSSFDTTIKSHGLKSGQTLKVFRGHSSYVNDILYLGKKIISASSDGSIMVFYSLTTVLGR